MRIPERMRRRLERWAKRTMEKRPPDFIIRPKGEPQTLRWWIIPRNRFFNVYLHKFVRSDEDRALHDHPWPNASILVAGEYVEYVKTGQFTVEAFERHQGFVYLRKATAAHRVELYSERTATEVDMKSRGSWINGTRKVKRWSMRPKPVITLFITGPKIREWGFLCPQGWRHWQVFCDERDHGVIGRGCE